MSIEDIKILIAKGETRTLELKKSTGELKEAMHTACAFLNGDGGWLVFGITPESLRIMGQEVSDSTQREIAQALSCLEPAVEVSAEYIDVPETAGRQLIAIHFDGSEEGHVPFTYNGRAYYKVESTTKLMPREMYDERLRTSNPRKFAWETQVAEGITISDLSEERIRNAVRGGIKGGRINASAENDSIESLLEKFKLLRNGKVTNAAVVLFGKNLYDYPQLMLRMAYFRGKEKMVFIDNKQAEGNFFDLLDAGIAFCFRNLRLSGEVKGLQREEHLEIPVEALREALTNALCHRRYDDYRTSVSLAIYDDRLEITNPGRLPVSLTPENIKEPHGSFPYNLRIAQVLYLTTFLEGWGTGVRRMIDICREQGVPEPEFSCDGYNVTITFWKSSQKAIQKDRDTIQINGDTTQKTAQKEEAITQKSAQKSVQKGIRTLLGEKVKQLSEKQLLVLTQIYLNNLLTRKEIAQINRDLTEDSVKYILSHLQELGLLRREGGRKKGHWVVTIGDDDKNDKEDEQ